MPRFLNHVNLVGNQLQNALIHPTASDPGSPGVSQLWFNTAAGGDGQGRLKIKLGTRTMIIDDQYVTGVTPGTALTNSGTALAPVLNVQAASGSVPGTLSTTDYTLLHTATNAATGSALVQRDSSGNAAFNQLTINNAPVSGTDAVNKAYADAVGAGFDPKGSAVLGTNTPLPSNVYANGTAGVGATLTASVNSTLSSTLIDGTSAHTLNVNDILLIKNEATQANNGLYVVSSLGSGASKWILTRATNFNSASSGPGLISNGAFCSVEQGANAATNWMVTGLTDTGITLGSTAITFSSWGSSQVYTNGNGVTLSSNTFSINLTGTNTLEFNSTALRLKSSATSGQVLVSGGTGVEPSYGAVNLASANAVSGYLGKANGGFGQDVSTGVAANLFAASPNGSSGAMGFRAIAPADFPTAGLVGAGSYTKITFDAYGRPTGSATLASTDIPSLDFAKITTGIVPTAQGGSALNLASIKDFPGIERIPVRVAVNSNVTLATPGATLDSTAMSAGDRVLLTAQSTGSQNGFWIWNGASSAMTRPTDYPSGGTAHAFYGVAVEVLAGTVYQGTTWYISTTGAITIDTTSVTWTQISFSLTSGVTGNLGTANGGTGSNTAAGARTNLNAAGLALGTITGDGTTTSFSFAHNLSSTKAKAVITDPTLSNEEIYPTVQYTDTNNVAVIFAQPPTNGATFSVRVTG